MTRVQLFSGNPLVHPYPGIPDRIRPELKDRMGRTLDDAVQSFPELAEHIAEPQPGADFEDFWEEAVRAATAVRAARLAGVPIEAYENRIWNEDEMQRRLGPVAIREEARHASDPLLFPPVLQKHGGRWISLGCIPDDVNDSREDNLLRQLAGQHRQGVSHAVIKIAARKSGVFRIPLSSDPGEIYRKLLAHESLGYDLMRNGDTANAYLAQDHVPMEHEYRFFIVDGCLVTGAGCVEEFTSFDREPGGSPFHNATRRLRGNGLQSDGDTSIVKSDALVERYLEFVTPIAEAHGGTVGIDVAHNPQTNAPLIVELNTLPNCGLYAADADALYRALITANDRGYGDYAFTNDAPFAGIGTLLERLDVP